MKYQFALKGLTVKIDEVIDLELDEVAYEAEMTTEEALAIANAIKTALISFRG